MNSWEKITIADLASITLVAKEDMD